MKTIYQDYYTRAYALIKEKNYGGAIAEFNAVLAQDPDDVDTLEQRAYVYGWKGDNDKALADYSRVIELEPDDPENWSLRGQHYHDTREYDKAIADFTKCIGMGNGPDDYWYKRGLSYYEKGEYEKAIADFSRSLAIKPDNSYTLYKRGAVYFDLADYGKAVADFTKTIELEPDSANNWVARGTAYSRKGSCPEYNDQAIKDMDKAVELAPEDARALMARGAAYLTSAAEHFDMMSAVLLYRARDEAERLVLLRKLELKGLKDFIPSADRMLRSLQANTTKAENLVMKVCQLLATDDLKDAIDDLTKSLSIKADNEQAFHARGRCYALLGDRDKALADFDSALAVNPDYDLAVTARAKLLDATRNEQ
jgi:tetratricopeptide (TPR) repeat protein